MPTPTSLSDYPVYMNSTEIPFFASSWQRKPKKLQNANQSEGGRDIIQQIRKDKMEISVSYDIADYTWVKFFEELNEMDSFVLKEYSPKLNAYSERTVRIEDFADNPVDHSEKLSSVIGVWNVSFTLVEF